MNSNQPKVKDFVVNVQEKVVESKSKDKKERKPYVPDIKFSVVLQNDIDFVINRKTKLTDNNLVFLISQSTFYIINNKTEVVSRLSKDNLKKFLKDGWNDVKNMLNEVLWVKRVGFNVDKLHKIAHIENIQTLFKHHYFNLHPASYIVELGNRNPKLFKYTMSKTQELKLIELINTVDTKINHNNVMFLLDTAVNSNIDFDIYNSSYRRESYNDLLDLINTYNLNFNRFVKYLFEDLYSQGISSITNGLFVLYRDYLDMQYNLYGKVKEKYPNSLKMEHDIVALRYTLYERHKQDLTVFEMSQEYKELEYTDKEYSIILPKTSMDFVDEGTNLSHCVASYVDKVVKKQTMIVFMRYTDDIDRSLVTVEIKNNCIAHVSGFGNRLPDKKEVEFLKKYAKLKGLKYINK